MIQAGSLKQTATDLAIMTRKHNCWTKLRRLEQLEQKISKGKVTSCKCTMKSFCRMLP